MRVCVPVSVSVCTCMPVCACMLTDERLLHPPVTRRHSHQSSSNNGHNKPLNSSPFPSLFPSPSPPIRRLNLPINNSRSSRKWMHVQMFAKLTIKRALSIMAAGGHVTTRSEGTAQRPIGIRVVPWPFKMHLGPCLASFLLRDYSFRISLFPLRDFVFVE